MPIKDLIMDSIYIFDTKIDCFTTESLNNCILKATKSAEHIIITNVNVHALNIAAKYPKFKKTIDMADYCFCDGHGVMIAARVLGKHIPEKITYADWFPKLAVYSEEHELKIFLLGGKDGIANKAAKRLKEVAPKIKIVGMHHGFFDKQNKSHENDLVIEKINNAKPHILLVCFGMPVQEYWIEENRRKINANVILNGGAALDYIGGAIQRPPLWMTSNGLEWLGRMLIEPRRLWKRYIIGNIIFSLRLFKEVIKHKKS